jgi:hypothetical protein
MAWGDGAGPSGGDNGGNVDAGNDAAGAKSSGANIGGYGDGSTSSGLSDSGVVRGLRLAAAGFGLGPIGAAIGLGDIIGRQPGATPANIDGNARANGGRMVGSGSNPIDTGSTGYRTYAPSIYAAEQQNGLAQGSLLSLLWSESNLNPYADNGQGYKGIAQFDPRTAARYGVTLGDPYSEISGAGAYLSDLVKKYGGNYQTAIANYKGSPTSPAALAQAQGVLNNAAALTGSNSTYTTPDAQSVASKNTVPNDKAFWQYSLQDVKDGFSSWGLGLLVGFIGVLIIVAVAYKTVAGKELAIVEK